MSRLNPPSEHGRFKGTPPEEADSTHVKMYIGNSIWHLGYCAKAFESDGRPDVAKLLRKARDLTIQAKELWRK